MNDSGKIAFYWMFPLSKNTNPKNINQLKLIKDY